MGRVFADGSGDWSSIPNRVIPNTQKMVLDSSWLIIQHYKVRIKGKGKQYREKRNVFQHLGVVATEKEALGSPGTKVTNFILLIFGLEEKNLFIFEKMLGVYLFIGNIICVDKKNLHK